MVAKLSVRHKELIHKDLKGRCINGINIDVGRPAGKLPLRESQITETVQAIKEGKSISLIGPTQCHKTSVIQKLVDKLASEGFNVIRTSAHKYKAYELLPGEGGELSNKEKAELPEGYLQAVTFEDVGKAVEEAFSGKDKVLIIDEFTGTQSDNEKMFRKLIPKLQKNGVKLVVGFHPNSKKTEELLGKNFKRVELEALSPEEEGIILEHVGVHSPKEQEKIKQEFGGQPALYSMLIENPPEEESAGGVLRKTQEEIDDFMGGNAVNYIQDCMGDKDSLQGILDAADGKEIDKELYRLIRQNGVIIKRNGKDTLPPFLQKLIKSYL